MCTIQLMALGFKFNAKKEEKENEKLKKLIKFFLRSSWRTKINFNARSRIVCVWEVREGG